MKWTKVTPETMPHNIETVLISIRHDFGDGKIIRWVETNVRYNQEKGWEYLVDAYIPSWSYYPNPREITHWMKLPDPAEDDE